MTSLHHHSGGHHHHHSSHHHVPGSSNSTSATSIPSLNANTTSVNMSLNSSTNALSPVIQRKIDTNNQQTPTNLHHQHSLTGGVGSGGVGVGGGGVNSRYSSTATGIGGSGILGGGVDFDTTSIASVSESSHWSGGGGDDLDNIALVNGSDTNTMENKDWCTYLKLGKNGYNSSDEDDDDDDDEGDFDDGDYDESNVANGSKNDDSSLCEEAGTNVGAGAHRSKHSRHRKSKRINSTNSSSSNLHASNKGGKAKSKSGGGGGANISSSSSSLASASKAARQSLEAATSKHAAVPSNGHHHHRQTQPSEAVEPKQQQQQPNGKKFNPTEMLTRTTHDAGSIADNGVKAEPGEDRKAGRSSRHQQHHSGGTGGTGLKHHVDSKFQKRGDGSSGAGHGGSSQMNAAANETGDDAAAGENHRTKRNEDDDNEESYENVDDDEEENDDNEDDNDEDDDDEDDDDSDEDDLDDDDIWTIKPKLHSYYEKQFKTMQPNLNGYITGAVAKPFFERSRLPLNELSKIWELSDVTKDGALSFSEFCTAMHLVVLRVRNFELPNELPAKLQPYAPLIDFNSEAAAASMAAAAAGNRHEDSMANLSDSEDITMCSPSHMTKSQSGGAGGGVSGQLVGPNDRPLVFGTGKPVPADSGFVVAHPVALRINNQHQPLQQPTGLIPEPPPRHSRSSSLGAIIHNALPNGATPVATNAPQTPAGNPPTAVTTPATPGQQTASAFGMPPTVPGSAPGVIGAATSKLQQQPPAVPPRITSPPPAHLVQQQQQLQQYLMQSQEEQFANGGTATTHVSAGPLLPPPPPPLPLNHQHLHRLQQHQLQQQLQQQHHQQQQQHHHHSHLVQQHSVPAPGAPIAATRAPPPPPTASSQYSSSVPPVLPAMPTSMTASMSGHVASNGAVSLEDGNRLLERLVEQMQQLNVDKLRKISETSQARTLALSSGGGAGLTLGPGEIEALAHSIRAQTEQNQLLKRSYAELEKEFRNLTDSRIALEIKLDILNTSSLVGTTATPTLVATTPGAAGGLATSVITSGVAATTSTGLQSPISLANAGQLAGINSTPASTNVPTSSQQQQQTSSATIQAQQSAASSLATAVKSKTANMNLIHSTPISTLQTPLSAASGVLLANQLAGTANAGNHGNAAGANANSNNLIAASAANQTNATSSKLII